MYIRLLPKALEEPIHSLDIPCWDAVRPGGKSRCNRDISLTCTQWIQENSLQPEDKINKIIMYGFRLTTLKMFPSFSDFNGKHPHLRSVGKTYSSSKTTNTMYPFGLSTPNAAPKKKKKKNNNNNINNKYVDLTCARASFIDCHSGTRHALSRTKQGTKNFWFANMST